MKLFLKRIFLFTAILLLPLSGISIPMLRLGYISGEFYTLDEMTEKQLQSNILIGTGASNVTPYVKYKMTGIVKPEILVVGTSRALYIKQEHFLPGTVFYNSVATTQNLNAYSDFIRSLETSPRHILMNLDQWQFNRNYFEQSIAELNMVRYDYKNGYSHDPVLIFRRLTKMLLQGDISLFQKLRYPENIGLAATVYGDGFGKDGFYVWTRKIESEEYRTGAAYNENNSNISKGGSMFAFGNGDELYGESVNKVEEILRLCKERGIMVTAFLPPFAPSVYRQLMESGHYTYMSKIYPALLPLFEKYGFELFDFTDASGITDDTMTYDGYHADDRGNHRMLLSMKAQNSVLADYIAPE
jgi:hypothetical protein